MMRPIYLLCAITVGAYAIPLRRSSGLTESGLLSIAPTSESCAGASFPAECRTAAEALPYILDSFQKYDITHAPVQAALVSLMAYESGEFKYSKNHYPGVAGQGTRNMQSPAFNSQYADSLGLSSITGNPNTMMETLMQDKYSFGSAAWFVDSQCPFSIRQAMWSGSSLQQQQAWENYITNCVGTDPSEPGRLEYWQKAMRALGPGYQ